MHSAKAAERWFRRVCEGKASSGLEDSHASRPAALGWAALWPPNRKDDLGLVQWL